jgi:hypothetical protein
MLHTPSLPPPTLQYKRKKCIKGKDEYLSKNRSSTTLFALHFSTQFTGTARILPVLEIQHKNLKVFMGRQGSAIKKSYMNQRAFFSMKSP